MTLIYGYAHMGKSLFWYSSELLFAYFLTELAGLPFYYMGGIVAAGYVISALLDLLIGFGMRQRLAVAPSAARLQLCGAILSSFSLALIMLVIWIPACFRFEYALLTGIVFRLSYAFYDIPQNALLALATGSSSQRLRIASVRMWFSGIATLVVAAAIGPLIASRYDFTVLFFLLGIAVVIAFIAISGAWLLQKRLHGYASVLAQGDGATENRRSFSLEICGLILVTIATSALIPAFGKLEPYFATYSLKSAWWGGVTIMLMAAGGLTGLPLWIWLCQHKGAGQVMALNGLLQLICLWFFWLTGATHPMILSMIAFCYGIGSGGIGMIQWAAYADAVAKAGLRHTGTIFALFAVVSKISLAAGILLLATSLSAADLQKDGGAYIVYLMVTIPGMGAGIAMLVGVSLSLARKGRERITSDRYFLSDMTQFCHRIFILNSRRVK